MSYGEQLHYRDGTLRVGCWACDYVMSLQTAAALEDKAEAILHRTECPRCGALGDLHGFGEFGCYPSEVGEPPCRR